MSIRFPDTWRAEEQKSIKFVIVGNIPVKVHAEPDSRIKIGGRNLGRATSGSEAVGYEVAVRLGVKRGSPLSEMIEPKSAAPPSSGTSTTAYEAELSAAEGEKTNWLWHRIDEEKTNWMWHKIYGELSVTTNSSWSANGGLPLAGNYVGQVTITLTPDF